MTTRNFYDHALHLFLGAFRRLGLRDQDLEAYQVALRLADVRQQHLLAAVNHLISHASEYARPPAPDELVDLAIHLPSSAVPQASTEKCPVCQNRRRLPLLQVTFSLPSGPDEAQDVRTLYYTPSSLYADPPPFPWPPRLPATPVQWTLTPPPTAVPCPRCHRDPQSPPASLWFSLPQSNSQPAANEWQLYIYAWRVLFSSLQASFPSGAPKPPRIGFPTNT